MFFLLPPKEITEPIVKNFKTALSQINDINYQTLPLCNVKGIISSNVIPQIKAPNPAAATKSVQSISVPVPLIKKSAAATKSKPASLTLNLVTKCSSCGWDFPLSFEKADKDSHSLRCKQGLGEKDPKLWESCKGNKEEFKKKLEKSASKKNEKVNENIESKPVKQKEVVALRQTPSSSHMMEIESEHSDFESDIKIKKKMRPKKAIKSVSLSQINNKKRRTPVIPPPQSNSNITYDSSNLPFRDDTKKIKKTVLPKPDPPSQPIPNFLIDNESRKRLVNLKVPPVPQISGIKFDMSKAARKGMSNPFADDLLVNPSKSLERFGGTNQ